MPPIVAVAETEIAGLDSLQRDPGLTGPVG